MRHFLVDDGHARPDCSYSGVFLCDRELIGLREVYSQLLTSSRTLPNGVRTSAVDVTSIAAYATLRESTCPRSLLAETHLPASYLINMNFRTSVWTEPGSKGAGAKTQILSRSLSMIDFGQNLRVLHRTGLMIQPTIGRRVPLGSVCMALFVSEEARPSMPSQFLGKVTAIAYLRKRLLYRERKP